MQKTELYKNDATELYQNWDNRTQIYGDFEAEEHGLKISDKIALNAKNYTILDIISNNSGEAVIYKIQNTEKQAFALKLYFEFRSEKDEPNPESLRRILQISNSDLLKLHDFGVAENKFQGKYCFEISDFAEGGDLFSIANFTEKYSPKFLETNVIPQIFKGIQTLHRNKIFHCDLKPQNVFFQNSEQTNLVIGDYGSAKTFDFENGKDARKTSTVKGTDFYLPPEQARGFISEKNDYYSFGMILLHLIYPEKVCNSGDYTKLSRQKLKEIIVKQFENEPIIEFDESKGRINDLIQGLTLNNVLDRWNEDEVGKWLRGEKITAKNTIQNRTKQINPIDLGDRIITTEKDFIRFLEEDKEWYELLFEDRTGHQLYDRWLLSLRGEKERQEVSEIVRKYQQQGIEFIKEALIRFFEPVRPLRVENDWFDLTTSEDLKFETTYYLARLVNTDLSENELQTEGFKLLQYFKNQKNRPDFQRLLRVIENTRNMADPALPRTQDVPRAKYIKDWFLEIIWEFALPISTDDTFLKIEYLGFRNRKIQCYQKEVLENYFTENGQNIFVEKTQIIEFSLPDFGIELDDHLPEKTLNLERIIFQTQKMISDKINTTKKVQFCNFYKFEYSLVDNQSAFWGEYWSGQFYRLSIQNISRNLNEDKLNFDPKIYHISYKLQLIKKAISYENGELKILHSLSGKPMSYRIDSDLLLAHYLKELIIKDVSKQKIPFRLIKFEPRFDKKIKVSSGANTRELQLRKLLVGNTIKSPQKNFKFTRRKFFTCITYPSLTLFQIANFFPSQIDNGKWYFCLGVMISVFSGGTLLGKSDIRWLGKEIMYFISFMILNATLLNGNFLGIIVMFFALIISLFKESEYESIEN